MTASPRRNEGDWFAIPLAAGGYAVGLVARAPRRGHTLFGYFFGPIRPSQPGQADVAAYRPDDAIRVCRFLDYPLVTGRWPIIARTEEWDRLAWPMLEFHVPDSEELLGEAVVVAFADDNPGRFVSQRAIPASEASRYPPEDGVFPGGHLEHNVGEWLGAAHIEDEAASMYFALRERGVRHFLIIPNDRIEEARRRLIELGLDEVEVIDREEQDEDNRVWMTARQREGSGGVASSLAAMEESLTRVAHIVGGVYDGPEWSAA